MSAKNSSWVYIHDVTGYLEVDLRYKTPAGTQMILKHFGRAQWLDEEEEEMEMPEGWSGKEAYNMRPAADVSQTNNHYCNYDNILVSANESDKVDPDFFIKRVNLFTVHLRQCYAANKICARPICTCGCCDGGTLEGRIVRKTVCRISRRARTLNWKMAGGSSSRMRRGRRTLVYHDKDWTMMTITCADTNVPKWWVM